MNIISSYIPLFPDFLSHGELLSIKLHYLHVWKWRCKSRAQELQDNFISRNVNIRLPHLTRPGQDWTRLVLSKSELSAWKSPLCLKYVFMAEESWRSALILTNQNQSGPGWIELWVRGGVRSCESQAGRVRGGEQEVGSISVRKVTVGEKWLEKTGDDKFLFLIRSRLISASTFCR